MARRKLGNKNIGKKFHYCWDSNHQYLCYRSLTNCAIIIIYKNVCQLVQMIYMSTHLTMITLGGVQGWKQQNPNVQFLVSKDRTMTPMGKKKIHPQEQSSSRCMVEELMLALAELRGCFFPWAADNKQLRLSCSGPKMLSPKWTGTLEQTQGGKVWLWNRAGTGSVELAFESVGDQ